MFSRTVSAVVTGMDVRFIQVEADVSNGLPYFELVGYLSSEVKEARERVRTALRNAGFVLEPKRILVNLSPADIRKSGTRFDLAIAIAVLGAYGFIPLSAFENIVIIGELSLDGHIKPVNGTLPVCISAAKEGYKACIVHRDNAQEGAASGIQTFGFSTLKEVVEHLNGISRRDPVPAYNDANWYAQETVYDVDFSDIHGQDQLKRSMEIAAAGMHHLMMIGPPGSGKSMAARRLPTILPELSFEESLEISAIYSVAGLLDSKNGLMKKRPFRDPHHTITDTAMVGGGGIPKPGEISLAHRGVLFLDELTEFSSKAMETLRQPLEERQITINRQYTSCTFPADFMLVAAINPCKCGYFPDFKKCNCTPLQIRRYIGKISRPLMDRIDLTVEVQPVKADVLQETSSEETSAMIRERVEAARQLQQKRYEGTGYFYNSQISGRDIHKYCPLGEEEQKLMHMIYTRYELTTRSYEKILKVARTIADLEGCDRINCEHINEAVFYKTLDRKYWGGTTYGRQ